MKNDTGSTAQLPLINKPHYMVQLDALRVLAVFGVLVYHFLPQEIFLNSKLHWGPLGVRLFFVLSGFLITGILLRCRDTMDLTQQDAWFTIKKVLFKALSTPYANILSNYFGYCSYRL